MVDLIPYRRCCFCFTCLSGGSKKHLSIFTLIQILAIKKPAEAGFFRKLYSAGAESN
ncbi:hypothetical protein EATG_03169 [Escherichia coli H605]|uniref:Uncharacterized protein n=1 Tax=Escherichia coli H605 TaxID=656410 RepID=A0AAJ3P1Z3_ECOLX|nr:hypothetical protein EATG_03169 [Escherichia coli H605]